ncbi:MAG: hypothetical protein KGD65_11970 [Candidatus Lokiarchaeota archaeon]|nr:hypothetical protein [Candidatus Lokiarchaeota archaeon]
MPDFEEIEQNFESSDITANFIIVFKDEIDSIEGWIMLEETLNEFNSHLQEEIEYYWGEDYADMKDYSIFHLNTEDKNTLKEIDTDKYYQNLKTLEQIFIVILHKEIKYRIIENLPPVFEWFMESSF